jgi:hypothetical protein
MTDESTVFDAAFEYNMNGMSLESAAEAGAYDEKRDARIAELETALLLMVNHEVNYMDINNLGDPEEQHRIKQARAALKAKP